MDIVLYGRPYNRSDRVQWTLEVLGQPYQYRVLDVFGLEHRVPRRVPAELIEAFEVVTDELSPTAGAKRPNGELGQDA